MCGSVPVNAEGVCFCLHLNAAQLSQTELDCGRGGAWRAIKQILWPPRSSRDLVTLSPVGRVRLCPDFQFVVLQIYLCSF